MRDNHRMNRMIPLAIVPTLPRFNFAIFFSLLLVIVASGVVFFFLTHRWTLDRRRAALSDWASEKNFSLRLPPRAQLPAALQSLTSVGARVKLAFTRGPISILQLTTIAQPNSRELRWHVLLREMDRAWSPAGLRPINPAPSFLDLFALNGFPSLLPPERFAVFATEPSAARAMAKSPVRGLLPPDIGLLVHGPYVTLDFSRRPFDTIEFERMLVVMEQLVRHLPAQAETAASRAEND
jgi:hypothetical protein